MVGRNINGYLHQRGYHQSGKALLIGVLFYMLTCNILIVVPPLSEIFAGKGNMAIPRLLHTGTIGVMCCLVLGISLLGFAAILGRSKIRVRMPRIPIAPLVRSDLDDLDIGLVFVSILCFYFVVLKGDGLNGDSGLYHIPHIFHLVRHGLEWGLSNWDLRYTSFSVLFCSSSSISGAYRR